MSEENTDQVHEGEEDRFRILVCIDGSDESYRGLRYAAKLGGGVDADIILLYVRPIDQGLRSGGLQVNVARQNMMDWGIDLPGIRYLKQGRDLLCELGVMSMDWQEKFTHVDISGSTLGDNKIEYIGPGGKEVVLKLKVAPSIARGILDQFELNHYDLVILGASERWRTGRTKSFRDPAVAEKIAFNAPCSVIVARELSIGSGHLICTDGSPQSMDAVRRDAYLASRCKCPISLISIASDEESRPEAEKAVADAKAALDVLGIEVVEAMVRVGDPVREIVEAGPDYSLVVVSDTGKGMLERFFMGSVAFKVMETSYNSVMVVR
ncbi:MAG: universal stress protein [Rhodospirillales bacterium]|nr:universal stress protein [Rhodospirillales bacterium]MCW8861094.1 universal stress protein [Rhodospirillales bacterium]MCW8952221.1 universal stress protein [Rhodospirillales bacterium]MCW8970564.1 universal stress protein [Rhodospirillales bacterium]MCW9002820.1 universal stress protein [Rhodospirillales bacterium]